METNNDIVILEDVDDLREVLCTYLEMALHIRCLAHPTVKSLQSAEQSVLHSRVAILDLELGPGEPSGIEAFKWLVANKFEGKIYFLTGHGKFNPLVEEATKFGADILSKPIVPSQLVQQLEKHLSVRSEKFQNESHP